MKPLMVCEKFPVCLWDYMPSLSFGVPTAKTGCYETCADAVRLCVCVWLFLAWTIEHLHWAHWLRIRQSGWLVQAGLLLISPSEG